MPYITLDPESGALGEHFALVKSPRRNRQRYPEGCVTLVETAESALQQADPVKNLHPALVYGPSVSSESQRIYYLVRWLDGG